LALVSFKCKDFRCLEAAELEFDAGNNLIFGANASGKTSILEAVGYLGRGRSFRGASTRELIHHGADKFIVTGIADTGVREVALGAGNSDGGLEVRTDGEKRSSAAALAEVLPLQIVDPEVHELIGGGPEKRRRYIDWIAFHVEPGYLEQWRRYRRSLKQRNATLREGAERKALSAWNRELALLGEEVDSTRRRILQITAPMVEETGADLLGSTVGMEYSQGWAPGKSLGEVLAESADRDYQLGSTQAGPHRADLKLSYDERQARKRVSRGQQKLLACALIVAATRVVQTALERPLLLLLDDPAAELDVASVARLMESVEMLGSQVIATTLDPARVLFHESPMMFHVERGIVKKAS